MNSVGDITQALTEIFSLAVKEGGSDIHIKPNNKVKIRLHGSLVPVNGPVITAENSEKMVLSTMTDTQQESFIRNRELDYALVMPNLGRFRVNAYYARGNVGLVARLVKTDPIPLSNLGVPDAVRDLSAETNGLVLITGATGSGKTTTLAGIIDYINKTRSVNVVTIEDPIEFLFEDDKASIIQRELYADTLSFASALRSSLRQDPDVILVGELRDKETVETALRAAETGHLVLSTMHTNSAGETLDRLLDFFSASEKSQIRGMLSTALRGVVCQRLVKAINGGRQNVVEVMINTGRIPDAIAGVRDSDYTEIIESAHDKGMQSFEDHLERLVGQGRITPATALRNSTRKKNLEMRLDFLKR